ncbi:hypothetical protein [Prosthecobacter vanneervenii]|uniref:Uncharacterized protein n=1 Tax=Prosthecobacter vanneervenii TaxID=48466 RepID=A0A7W8DHY2_9BACT|nr:hypothetical protein [Prosthecobacter vanneervenii]MBB5030453.1 hypothetical protein [Prosthecobacter vanneervenii]
MNSLHLKNLLVLLILSHGFALRSSATEIINSGPSLSVVQGDAASFNAQFFDADGNGGVDIRAVHVATGQTIGQFVRSDDTGDLQWTCDTSTLPTGTNPVQLIATDPAGESAVVSISLQINPASSVQQWRQTHFGSSQNSGAALNSADPDGDGLNNFAEFAFGLDPKIGNPDVGNRIESDAGRMKVMFRRRKDYQSAGLNYIYEFSNDLQGWEASSFSPQVLSDDGTMENLTLEFPMLSNGQTSRFFRTRVE